MIILAVLYLLLRKVYSEWIACFVTVFLGLNEHFTTFSINLWCENVFTLWVTLAWLVGLMWLDKNESNHIHTKSTKCIGIKPLYINNLILPVLFGLFCGLAYLTKDNGTLLVCGFVLIYILQKISEKIHRKKIEGSVETKKISIAVAIFLLVAGTYWIINLFNTGSIFRNFDLRVKMWLDNGIQCYFLYDTPPGFKIYWDSHTIGEMLQKFIIGCKKQWWNYVNIYNLSPLWTGGKIIKFGWVLFPLSIFGMIVPFLRNVSFKIPGGRWGGVYTLFLFTVWYTLFAWYHHIDVAPRFIFPLIIPLFITMIQGGVYLWKLLNKRINISLSGWLKWAFPAILLLMLIMGFIKMIPHYPSKAAVLDIDRQRLISYCLNNTSPEDVIAYGPSHGFSLRWLIRRKEIFIPVGKNLSELLEYFDEYNAKYFLLDMEINHRRPGLFKDIVKNDPKRGFILVGELPGWKVVSRGKMYYLFKRYSDYDKVNNIEKN